MYLPELSFAPARLHGEELFLGPNSELTRVLLQGNPVYLNLVLPGATQPKVRICFPKVGTTWVFTGTEMRAIDLVGEFTESDGVPTYTPVEYRYGMELKPWMFFRWLDFALGQSRCDSDNIVNYSILNCSSGHTGVLIRIIRGSDRVLIAQEWMEIYYFSTGNDFDFPAKWRKHPNTRLIARFVPRDAGTSRLWWASEPLTP